MVIKFKGSLFKHVAESSQQSVPLVFGSTMVVILPHTNMTISGGTEEKNPQIQGSFE